VATSPDGTRVFVTGTVEQKGDFGDIETVAYDAATGNELWAARTTGPPARSVRARSS
jgi:PQQ enzyme repeat